MEQIRVRHYCLTELISAQLGKRRLNALRTAGKCVNEACRLKQVLEMCGRAAGPADRPRS